MSDPVRITSDLLLEAGGWREMKAARLLHGAGAVADAAYADGVLSALVRERGSTFKAKLKIHSRTDMENLCSCSLARRDGIICAHVLAAGLEVIDPRAPAREAEPVPSASGPAAAVSPRSPSSAAVDRWPRVTETVEDGARPATCHVVLPPRPGAAWEKGRILVGVEIDWDGGERRLLSAVPDKTTLFAGPRDAALLAALKAIAPREVPGMLQLGREDFLLLLDALAGHPRVTFGRQVCARVLVEPFRPALDLDRKNRRLRVRWPCGEEATRSWARRRPGFSEAMFFSRWDPDCRPA